ncbi:MAG: FAD-binding oxidoreductase, partial [Mycobacteriales bacterium]
MTSIATRLASALGPSQVLTDPSVMASYQTDWTGRFHGVATCVVRPVDREGVAAVLREALGARTPVCPQGGNTGLVGGAVPSDGSVVLSTARLTSLEIDEVSAQAQVGAGVSLLAVQDAARARGFDFGVDLAARASATVGGMFA